VSSVPEEYGADFLWRAHGLWWGVQRKEVKDLLASVADGRLSKELAQMKSLESPLLIIEGTTTFTVDGVLMSRGSWGQDWTRQQWNGLSFSVLNMGVGIVRSSGLKETAGLIRGYKVWSEKEKHAGLKTRPGPQVKWGRPGNKDFQIHLLMGLPGVGYELAKRIVERFGGVPWYWTVTEEQLMQVEGVGKKKAEAMLRCLEREIGGEQEMGNERKQGDIGGLDLTN